MTLRKQNLAQFSPLLFGAACVLLTIIISVFAINNYHREKKLMISHMIQQAETISRFVNNSTRAALMKNIRRNQVDEASILESIQNSLENTGDHPGIQYIYVIYEDGNVLASTVEAVIGSKIDNELLSYTTRERNGENKKHFRIHNEGVSDKEVFQLTRKFKVLKIDENMFDPTKQNSRMKRRMGGQHVDYDQIKKEFSFLIDKEMYLILELDMSAMHQAVQRQLYQLIGLSVVLLLVGMAGWLSIITLQGLKGSQTKLRKVEAFRNLLVSAMPVGLIATDEGGELQVINDAACDILHIEQNTSKSLNITDLLPTTIHEKLTESKKEVGGAIQAEMSFQSEDGVSKSILLYKVTIEDHDGSSVGSMLLLQDVTDFKALEADLQRNERFAALGKVAAGVAHELRNPLSSIKGLATILKPKLRDKEQDGATIDMMVNEIERLDRSISELLTFTRPEKLELDKIELGEVAGDAVKLVATDFESGGINVIHDSVGNNYVSADYDKLKQVYLNIFINSIQAMENGGEIQISTNNDGEFAICSLTDNGCGMTEEVQKRVFDPYFTTKNEGTGLGLSLSTKIIEEHGGSLNLVSTEGSGTTVTIKLPLYS